MKLFILIMLLFVGCGSSSLIKNEQNISQVLSQDKFQDQYISEPKEDSKRVYGTSLAGDVVVQDYGDSVLYRPKILDSAHKIPVVLFAPGWGSKNYLDYNTILSFIASQGYAALYVSDPSEYDPQKIISRFSEVLENKTLLKYLDTSRIGVVGHSSGGGFAFVIIKYFADKGLGKNGMFIFSMDPWFAFGMGSEDFKNFPKNCSVVIQQFGDSGGTDPRIALTIFDKLSSLGDKNRDYQVYKDLNHAYPFGSGVDYSQKQVILQPLDALMDLTFWKKEEAYPYALELGTDSPYGSVQEVKPSVEYPWKCYGENQAILEILDAKDINYCKIIP